MYLPGEEFQVSISYTEFCGEGLDIHRMVIQSVWDAWISEDYYGCLMRRVKSKRDPGRHFHTKVDQGDLGYGRWYDTFISSRGEDTRHNFDALQKGDKSFRGKDTQSNFTHPLYDAFREKQIHTFGDGATLEKGDKIGPAMPSPLSIIIFSENYASSKWCFDELARIIESKDAGKVVIPIFYEVDPSHVRKQTCSYTKVFQTHEKDCMLDEDWVKHYRVCLIEAASFCGYDSESMDYGTKFNQTERSGTKAFLSRSMYMLPGTIFSFSKMTADDGGPLKLALRNVTSDQYPIVTDGPLSSIKIDICVLAREFGSHGSEDWTVQKFNGSILQERDGEGPQLYEEEHLRAYKINMGKPDKLAALNQQKRREMMARFSSSLVTLTFPLLLCITVFMNPLCEIHGSKSMLLSLLATFIFMVFGSAVSVMITVDAQFTRIQMILLAMLAVAVPLAAPSLLFLLVEVPVLIILIVT